MVFVFNDKKYSALTASEIVLAIKSDTTGFSEKPESLRAFLGWSLSQLTDQIHMRELAASSHVSDETLALNYLYLLDEHHLGVLSND